MLAPTEEDTFWRKLILCEEDHLAMGKQWRGGYRWFRSTNVIPLERWKQQRQQRIQPDEPDKAA
jgi:hypothetical protein